LFMKSRYVIGIGLAALVGFLCYRHHALNRPANVFATLVANPIPSSVRAIEQGHLLAMDSTFWVVRFQIDQADLQSLMQGQHFIPLNEQGEFQAWDTNSSGLVHVSKGEYLKKWEKNIYSSTHMDVDLPTNCSICTLQEGHGRKYFFFVTNSAAVVFIAEAH